MSESSHQWPAESYGADATSAGYQRAQNLHETPLTGTLLLLLFQRKQLQRTVFHAKAQIQLCGKHTAPPLTECAARFNASSNTARDKFGSAFAQEEGQRDCNICSVRNEPTAS